MKNLGRIWAPCVGIDVRDRGPYRQNHLNRQSIGKNVF